MQSPLTGRLALGAWRSPSLKFAKKKVCRNLGASMQLKTFCFSQNLFPAAKFHGK